MCRRRRGRRGRGRASAAARFRLNTDIRSKVVTAAVVPPLVFMELAVVVISARLVKDPTPYFSRIERVRFEVAVFRAHRMHALGSVLIHSTKSPCSISSSPGSNEVGVIRIRHVLRSDL